MIPRAVGIRAAALSIAVLTAAGSAGAYVREQSNWNPSSLPVHYSVNQSSIPSNLGVAAGVNAVEQGFATWASQPCTSWSAADDGNTTLRANTNDSHNTIVWLSGTWPAELGDVSVTIGITTPVWQVPGFFIDADIQFNNVGFTWVASCTTNGNSVDAQSIATHEEGHFLGLGHTPVAHAIMYASYSGGCKRTLDPDDQSGVCTIYPGNHNCTSAAQCPTGYSCVSGMCVPPTMPDAGMQSGCAVATDCLTCAQMATCGWCNGSNTCSTGTASGPVTGSCGSGWVWDPNTCGTPPPPDSGPANMGMGATGDPCNGGQDCTSGVCVSDGTRQFCSQVCNDDCNCPGTYHCYPTTGGTHVCAPGTHVCSTQPDSGQPVTDSGNPVPDAGGQPDAGTHIDASGTDVATAGDSAMSVGDTSTNEPPVMTSGCHCSTTLGNARGNDSGAALVFAAIGIATVITRRRRRS